MVCKVYRYTTFYPDGYKTEAYLDVAKDPSSYSAFCSYVRGIGDPTGWHKGYHAETEVDVTVGFNARGSGWPPRYANCKKVGRDKWEGFDPRGMEVHMVLLKEYILKAEGAIWCWEDINARIAELKRLIRNGEQ